MADAKVEGKEEFTFPDEQAAAGTPAETDVEIEVVDDTPKEDRGFKPGASKDVTEVSAEELSSYSDKVQKRIKELSFARHDERRSKEAAIRERQEIERIAQVAIDENKRLKEYVQSGEKVYQGTAKQAAQAKLDIAKSKYKAAHEAFDADALIAAQQELTQAQLELTAAENFRPTPLQPLQEQVYSDPTQQGRPDDRTVRWQQRNPWFGTDDEMTALALATHKRLVNSGIDPRSDEYWKRIDARIREKFPENFEEASSASTPAERESAPQPQRKPATVVAPTARSSSVKKVTLTQTQVALAKKFGIPLEEYAKQAALLETNRG